MSREHRDTIFLEEAEILSHQHLDGDQHLLRVQAPECAAKAQPGTFVHIQCDTELPLRRPISIMRYSATEGWVDFLYKALGRGTNMLAKRQPGEKLSMIGPIGKPFELHPERSRPLLIGGGVGMPPIIAIAESIKGEDNYKPLVILGSEVPFPFKAEPSKILLPSLPSSVIATMPLLDGWQIPCRLASQQGYAGCHQGYVTDLARIWLESLDEAEQQKVEIFSCGPHPMLEAVAILAAEFNLPCQVSLEEFMACGIGGCAGCVTPVEKEGKVSMKRVCVDGPVFNATEVFPA